MIGYHRPERLVEKLAFKVKVTWRSKYQCLSRCYLLNRQTFCYQTWYCDATSWAGVLCKMICLLFSRSRSQQGLVWSKCDRFYHIFWIANPCATKLGLIVHYHKLECLIKKLDCCVQGQDHSKISECLWLFIPMLSSEMLNLILPNLLQLCIIMSQIVV